MKKIIIKIIKLINFKKNIPVIVQNFFNKKILILAWVNKYCLLESYFFKKTCYWSRSKNSSWRKGQTSNNIQIIKKIIFDCDLDSIIFLIIQKNNSCYFNTKSCFNYIL
ncbi:phosphoribosyl-AMP cyclohydrolase [Candidatus Carsonella ruddii CS isolate Thao2000]|uniref:phosphoribosyl-AMP cyclohydrolase n=1 Tax=Candidatus Carsonella ruddii CS isolate Thao2000 TaxID=1202537 RepID=J7H0D0_CARRU|nr:phosphoribosyl-AMP cyclohydrolase [Candidatus Carsonella ruddii]AFP83760.1 phosphoribosyl-AMP cyclohydrolase [Candidatus Carsonella ruddii CS isolate Thao2000]